MNNKKLQLNAQLMQHKRYNVWWIAAMSVQSRPDFIKRIKFLFIYIYSILYQLETFGLFNNLLDGLM